MRLLTVLLVIDKKKVVKLCSKEVLPHFTAALLLTSIIPEFK